MRTKESLNTNQKTPRKSTPCLLVGFSSQHSVTGLALAFDLLLSGFEQRKLPYRVVDFGELGLATRPGSFDWQRLYETIGLLISFGAKLPNIRTVYLVIASSKLGFFRDAMMIWASRLFNRRVVLHLHGGGYQSFYALQPRWLQRVIAKTIDQADKIIVLGTQLRHQFAFVPNAEQKIRVVPNALPLGLQPTTTTAKSLSHDEPLQLLYLSNLIESKGYLVLLAACRILHHEYQVPIHCDFCGDFVQTATESSHNQHHDSPAQAKASFLRLVEEWALGDVVTYHGRVMGAQKQQLLQQTHAFILPTTYPWEGQPISIIEALAFATPVIATAHRGIPEQVIDDYNGFLVIPEPMSVANAVRELWQNPSRYQELSQNAKIHFQTNFSQEQHLDHLITVITGQSTPEQV
ncbi:MAG: glycosyltransferase family 4 protein [Chloroflexota bacterium]